MFKLLPSVLPKLARTQLSSINPIKIRSYATIMKYTKTHEYVKYDDQNCKIGMVGISSHARDSLGDIVYVEFPKQGNQFEKDDEFVTVESVKAVVECKIPVDGKILEVNDEIHNNLDLINSHAEDGGWLAKIEISQPSQFDDLMDKPRYMEYLEEIDEG
jgi:glycine cleavage system H protein